MLSKLYVDMQSKKSNRELLLQYILHGVKTSLNMHMLYFFIHIRTKPTNISIDNTLNKSFSYYVV